MKPTFLTLLLLIAGVSGAQAGRLESAYSELSASRSEAGAAGSMDVPAIPAPKAEAAAASTNYERRVDNPDGSVTFVSPRFSGVKGPAKIAFISSEIGVCKLYGAKLPVFARAEYLYGILELAHINWAGKLSRVEALSGPYVYDYIVCAQGAPAPSRQYKALNRNDDGSVTIVEPRFDLLGEGVASRISAASNNAGVCKLFGYAKHITSQSTYVAGSRETPFINAVGRFEKAEQDTNSGVYNYIVCAN